MRSLRATMTPLLATSAFLTIASGLVMMVQLHSQHPGSFSHSHWGLSLIIGAVASIGALAIAFAEARASRAGITQGGRGETTDGGRSLAHERSMRLAALAL